LFLQEALGKEERPYLKSEQVISMKTTVRLRMTHRASGGVEFPTNRRWRYELGSYCETSSFRPLFNLVFIYLVCLFVLNSSPRSE